jgi:hypothetical protein
MFRHEPTETSHLSVAFLKFAYLSHPVLDTFGNAQSPSPTLSPLVFTQLRCDHLSMTAATINGSSAKADWHKTPASSPSLNPLTPLLADEMAVLAAMDVFEGVYSIIHLPFDHSRIPIYSLTRVI